MRNHNRAVLLRLTDADYKSLHAMASRRNLTVQQFLRDMLHYGILPPSQFIDDKKRIKKDLTGV